MRPPSSFHEPRELMQAIKFYALNIFQYFHHWNDYEASGPGVRAQQYTTKQHIDNKVKFNNNSSSTQSQLQHQIAFEISD